MYSRQRRGCRARAAARRSLAGCSRCSRRTGYGGRANDDSPRPFTQGYQRAYAAARCSKRGGDHARWTAHGHCGAAGHRTLPCACRAAPPGQRPPHSGTPSVEIGYKLSCEEHSPSALVCYAKQAEEAGFTFAMLSDHYHPWIAEQGQSPFVWSVIGSIAQATERLRIGTGVTCPLIRMHPAIVAKRPQLRPHCYQGALCLAWGRERTSTNTSSATTGRQERHGVPCWKRPWPSSAASGKGPAEPSRPILYG